MEELDIHTVKLQNRELLAKVRQLKAEIDQTNGSRSKAEEALVRAQERTMAMAGCWDQARVDFSYFVKHFLSQIGLFLFFSRSLTHSDELRLQLMSDLCLISDQLTPPDSSLGGIESDFYSAVLNATSAVSSSHGGDIVAKYSEICKKSLSTIVSTLKAQRSESERLLAQLSSSSADQHIQAFQSEITVLKQERTTLMKQNEDLLAKERQRKRVELELRREAESARAAEKIATENANDAKSTLSERLRQLERLSIEYEKLQRTSKEAIIYRETKEAEEALNVAETAAAAATNGDSNHDHSGPADPALRAELEETKAKLATASAEAEALRNARKQAIAEVEDIRSRLHDAKITDQDAERHPVARNLRHQLDAANSEKASIARDLEHYKRLSTDSTAGRDAYLQRDNDRLRDELGRLQNSLEDRTRALKQLEQDKDRVKFDLDQAKAHQHSAEAVRSLLDSIKRLTDDRNRAVQDYTNARKEVEKLTADVQRLSTSDTKKLHLLIENLESKVVDLKLSEDTLKQELAKQEPLLNAYKMGNTPQVNELAELSARLQVLQEENAKMKSEATAAAAAAPASDGSQLQLELEQAKRKVANLEKQVAYYVSELDSMMPAYDELNATNERLQHQIVQGEEANMAIKADSRLADSAQQTFQKESQLLGERIRVLEQKLAAQVDLYRQEAKKNQLIVEAAAQSDSQAKNLQAALEEQKNTNRLLISAEHLLTARIQELHAQYSQLGADTKRFRIEAEDARSAVSKLEEERSSLNTKLNRSQRLGASGAVGNADARLREELELYKNYYYCSVCRINRNDTVLSQCGHITCRECVDKNVKSRSRKCPACSESFGTGDIVSVFYFS